MYLHAPLLIRETEIPPKPTLSVDLTEYRKLQKLMDEAQGEAKAIKRLKDVVKPGLEKQLSEITGLFKGRERKALSEKIEQVQQGIDARLDRIQGIVKDAGYPDVQAFRQVYDKSTALVEQYNRDLAAWEQQVNGKARTQQKPPEKESILKKLREYDAEAKRRNTERKQKPRHRSYDMER